MKYRVGQIFYTLFTDDEDGSVEVGEYHVRTIRGGYVHAIWKNNLTWGKRSNKNGDFGWLKTIPDWMRQKWRIDGEPRQDIKSTKLAAIRHEIKGKVVDNFDTPAAFEKAMKTLKSMETRAKTARKK